MECLEVARLHQGYAVARRFKIIEQHNVWKAQAPRERRAIDNPRQVGRVNAVVENESGYAESCRSRFASSHAQKILSDIFDARMFGAHIPLVGDSHELASLEFKRTQVCLRSAYVTGKNHPSPPNGSCERSLQRTPAPAVASDEAIGRLWSLAASGIIRKIGRV